MNLFKVARTLITTGIVLFPGYWLYRYINREEAETLIKDLSNVPEKAEVHQKEKTPEVKDAPIEKKELPKPEKSPQAKKKSSTSAKKPKTASKKSEKKKTAPSSKSKKTPKKEIKAKDSASSKELYNGKEVFVGAKGGKYYVNDSGRKVYLRD